MGDESGTGSCMAQRDGRGHVGVAAEGGGGGRSVIVTQFSRRRVAGEEKRDVGGSEGVSTSVSHVFL